MTTRKKRVRIEVTAAPAAAAGAALSELFSGFNQVPILFLFSGGSALRALDFVTPKLIPSDLTVAPMDERLCTIKESNLKLFEQTTFWQNAKEVGAKLLLEFKDFSDKAPNELGLLYEHLLCVWRGEHEHGVIIGLLGIGTDGHIASIFPGVSVSDEGRSVITHAKAPDYPCSQRITVTPHFLKTELAASIILAMGKGKSEVVHELQHGVKSESDFPAHYLHDLRRAILYTDCAPN